MLDINDYYLGIILAHPEYYKKEIRDETSDPFFDLSLEESLIVGVPTLLHRVEDTYYDAYFSRWYHEISYQEKQINSLSIVLAYVKPFSSYYKEDPIFYVQEDIEKDPEQLQDIISHHTYYIAHSKLTRKDAIVIIDETPLSLLRKDYLQDLLKENSGKKFIKS